MANWSSGQNTQPYTPTTVYSKEYQRVETLLTNNVGPTCETTLGNPKLGWKDEKETGKVVKWSNFTNTVHIVEVTSWFLIVHQIKQTIQLDSEVVKWSRHAAINSANKSITQSSQTIHPEHIFVVHNVRNRHKMFYSLVETGWFHIFVLYQEHFTIEWLAIARIGQRMQPSVVDFLQKPSTTVIWGFLEKFRQQLSEDSCKLRNHPRAIKRQILKLKCSCFIFHYLTDSWKSK